jgi:mannose-1-phosphate guanylyltransferase
MKQRQVFAFVMAGGSGERFWPMSRQSTPKHLLRLLDEQTLLEKTIRRLDGLIPLENTFVLTNHLQAEGTREAVPFLPAGNIVAEPAKRDTAPACALATAIANAKDPEALCVVLPADAVIHDAAAFRKCLAEALDAAGEGPIVTLGIPPTFPATGYGYLETGSPIVADSPALALKRFVEKPDLETATGYLKAGTYLWNAGIFVWKVSTFLDEAERQSPPLARFIRALPSLDALPALLEKEFATLPKISVDYAIMENAREVATVPATFDWDDVGAWNALPAHLPADTAGNSTRGTVVCHAARSNIAVSTGRMIALCGVENLVVVETPDAVLVCHKDAVQEVKSLQPLLPDSLK